MPGEYYLWAVDGKPVRVMVALPVIERLSAIVIENFRVSPDQPRECFGILFGRTRKEGRSNTVLVDDFELVSTMPAKLETEGDRQAVGLFRGRARGDLRLDPDDAAHIERLFHQPELIYLLVQPQVGAPARAGIFVQEKGSIKGFATYREFPFHAGLLRNGGFPVSDGRPVGVRRAGMGAAVAVLMASLAAGGYWAASRNSTPATPAMVVVPESTPSATAASRMEDKPSPTEPAATAGAASPANPSARGAAVAMVSLEPLQPNRFKRIFGKLRRSRFTPARAVARPLPSVPGTLAARLHNEVPVTLKLRVNKRGRVSDSEAVDNSRNPELTRLAAHAAEQWRFEPARMNERAVGSEVLARFRFRPADTP